VRRLFSKLAVTRTKSFIARLAAVTLPAGILVGALAPAAPAASGNWPAVSPYVDMGAWPTPSLSQMSQASGIKGFTLGFVTGAGCKASWFNAYDPRTAWQKEEIAKLRSAGGDVRISFGGAAGIDFV